MNPRKKASEYARVILSTGWTAEDACRIYANSREPNPVALVSMPICSNAEIRHRASKLIAEAIAELPTALGLLRVARCPDQDCVDGVTVSGVECCNRPHVRENGEAECCGCPDPVPGPCQWCAERAALVGIQCLESETEQESNR